jgi:predicted negative regulator of RcsB-dependent stress response
MATSLDLQEQEQLDALKAFWKQYGNLITWVLILALGAFAAWNGWNWYQRDLAVKAGAMFEELDRAALAGDAERAGRIFNDLKSRYATTTFAQHGALTAARTQVDKGLAEPAQATLTWAADNGPDPDLRALARLRLAGLLFEAKQYDAALKQLEAIKSQAFEALVADRRGDVLLAQGKADEARKAYQTAWAAMDEKLDYRRLVEAKLVALAAPPQAAKAPAGAASGADK